MRTKTLLLTAALCAVGVVTSVAQAPVYSVNAVGYVNVTLSPGYTLIANPLNGTNNNVNTIMPLAPADSVLFRWDNAGQSFFPADTYISSGANSGWYDQDFHLSASVINPGEGFFIQNISGAPAVLTFVGEVPQGALTNAIRPNFEFRSSIVPQAAGITQMGFPGVADMTFNFWDKAAQGYAQGLTYISSGANSGWYDQDFALVDPVPAVGEGFLIFNPGPTVQWGRTFSVNN